MRSVILSKPTVTQIRDAGPADTSSARVAAMKPSWIRFFSGVELSWIAPIAQWWLVTTSPSGETKLAVQPPSDTTADSGGLVTSASWAGSPLKPTACSWAASCGSCEGIHMPSSAWAAPPARVIARAAVRVRLRMVGAPGTANPY